LSIYSIKDLEKLSGIKAHTIRIWEQRYKLISPNRTQTNIRYYDDKELRKLLNVALLNKNGYKISKIASFSSDNINELVTELSASDPKASHSDNLTIAMINMDESKFHQIIDSKIKTIGFEQMMMEVIFPFLDKLYFLWLTGSINSAHENFISNLIRQKIIVAIDKVKKNVDSKLKFMLYLPEGEQHELSLLFMYYLIRSRGYKVYYLGQNISLQDVSYTYLSHKPDYVYTMISETFTKKPVGIYVDELSKNCPQSVLLLAGYQIAAQAITSKNKIKVLNTLPDTIAFLDHLGENNAENSNQVH
jgi:DNA-binding transcriptional MerR regulator